MPHSRTLCMVLGVATFMALGAAPVLAHGWLFVPPAPPAPPPAIGGGEAEYTGPVGGGELAEPEPPAPGTTTPPPSSTPDPRRGGVSSRTGGTTSRGHGGVSAGRSRPKGVATPWADDIVVPWKSVFPVSKNGYDKDLTAGVRLAERDGGWSRRDAPSLLFVYDAANEEHAKLLQRLNKDRRLVAAAHLFNCFRVAGKKGSGVKLSVFDDKGTLVSEIGGKKVNRAYKALEKAYDAKKGRDLSKLLPSVASILDSLAYCDHHVKWMERKIICPDCGHEREDVVETLGQMKVRRQALERALEAARNR